ncbi:Abi family protein [Companilactobacillus nodensis]|uniref:Abi family protein n=1 Tax=Companilactobacillus nodensis DSM 19682 = JCM 14932 = NBRC 107160 TaxID=1423775 RepID=A0A0R1K5H9_9LACO|nr:Abi family protein [Companilactobacillus nodensis]KRK78862.1 Abi family protein [Companilactobacillus nodensis DSM 19682 = JCM 14932 = NBRC 107160]
MDNKLTYDEMILKMKSENIRFDLCTEKGAKRFLQNYNDYYKLTLYLNNFSKTNKKYDNLDFQYLVTLINVDKSLKMILFKMSLDIERAVKTKIMDLITNDNRENGYRIVTDFKKYNPLGYEQTIGYISKTQINGINIPTDTDTVIPIWILLESMSFGTLCRFVIFYYKRSKLSKLKDIRNTLLYCKNIRNLTAHDNCFINNLFNSKNSKNKITRYIDDLNKKTYKLDNNLLYNSKINDIMCLFYIYSVYVQPLNKNHFIYDHILDLTATRMNDPQFVSCLGIKKMQFVLNKLIDFNLKID